MPCGRPLGMAAGAAVSVTWPYFAIQVPVRRSTSSVRSLLRYVYRDARAFVQAIADKEIVDPAAERAADTRRDDRDPPPAVAGAEDFAAPACDRGEEPRTEVARRIDGVARVEAVGRADQKDEQPDNHRHEPSRGRSVALVGDAQDHADEERRADDLIDEAARKRAEERLRVGGPDTGGSLRAEHLTDAAVERVQRLVIGEEHDCRCDERAA